MWESVRKLTGTTPNRSATMLLTEAVGLKEHKELRQERTGEGRNETVSALEKTLRHTICSHAGALAGTTQKYLPWILPVQTLTHIDQEVKNETEKSESKKLKRI